MEIEKNYSNELKKVLTYMSKTLLEDHPTTEFTPEYFVLAVLENKSCSAYSIIDDCIISENLDSIKKFYFEVLHSKSLTVIKPNRDIKYSPLLKEYFEQADVEREKLNDKTLMTKHVILAVLASSNPIQKIFLSFGMDYQRFFSMCIEEVMEQPIKKDSPLMTNNLLQLKPKKAKLSNIETYCINLNKLSDEGKIDKLIGRTDEINQIVKILGRRKKNNVILVGKSGSGKTQLIYGLADLIHNSDVPKRLINKKIVMLDITAMVAGTHYRGMFEERVKGLLDELKTNKDYILFIDDIHSVLSDKGSMNDTNISSMLSNALSDGEIQIIGATGFKEYKNTVESNGSLARKFQKVIVNPTSIKETIDILMNNKKYYEEYHNVTYTDEAVKACVELADRFISERSLPDSAIDVLDECGSNVSVMAKEPQEIIDARKELITIKHEKIIHQKLGEFDVMDNLTMKENKLKLKISNFERESKKNVNSFAKVVNYDDICKAISETTGIPITKLDTDEKKKLSKIDDILRKHIVGQDEAIEKVCKVIKRNKVGLGNQTRTLSNLFFLGPTGSGKTLLAKKLAEEVFGDEKYLVRIDMSEYSEKNSVAKLIGTAPGYIGYDNGGQLTEIIKHKKHCVLLLDEIEKADTEIFNLFLQLFDEGHLTDNSGQQVDFKNVIVILTSNVGAKEASERSKGIGFVTNDEANKKSIIQKELKKRFPPEFINRLDDIIYFNSLSDDNLEMIIDLELNKFINKLKDIHYDLSYDETVIKVLLKSAIEDKEYGARPIIRLIQDNIENQITDLILNDEYPNNYMFKAIVNNDNEIVIS